MSPCWSITRCDRADQRRRKRIAHGGACGGGGACLWRSPALTTDGVHGAIDERRLERLVADPDDLPGAASDIVRAAIARGSRDNCTAIVAQYLPD